MDLPVYFPNIKKGSTKDNILRLLTLEKKLTNQKIFLRIKKQFAVSITYQTVRQALLELVESGVLEKNGKEYSISIEWIKVMDHYIRLLKEKYIDKKEIKIVDINTKEINLNSLDELGHFILNSFKDYFFDFNRENDLYMMVHHLWFPFFHKNKREALQNFFSENLNFVYVSNKSMIDRVLSFFYKKFARVKLGFKFDEFFDIIIQGDCVAKIYFPDELRKRMDKVYGTKMISFKFIDEFTNMTYDYYNIKIIVTRGRQMAEEMKGILKRIK